MDGRKLTKRVGKVSERSHEYTQRGVY